MRFHNVWFDEEQQVGAGEYSFGTSEQKLFDHGVAVIKVRDDVISAWREYQTKGQADFSRFLALDGKDWQWHIGNYP